METIVGVLFSYEARLGLYTTALAMLMALGILGLRYKLQRSRGLSVGVDRQSIVDGWYARWRGLILGLGFGGYIGAAGAMCYGVYGVLTPTARVLSYYPQSQISSYNQEILVEFDVPIRVSGLRVNSFPEIEFGVSSEPSIWGGGYSRRFRLVPARSYPIGEKIMIYLSDAKNPFSSDFGGEHLIELAAAPAVTVVGSDPAQDAIDVAYEAVIIFYLSSEDRWGNYWSAVSEPVHEFSVEVTGNQGRVRPITPLSQGTVYEVGLYKTPVLIDTRTGVKSITGMSEKMHSVRFTTRKPPMVTDFFPMGTAVVPRTEIRISFEQPIDLTSASSAIDIKPAFTKPPISWSQGNTVATILAGTLQKDTVYTVTVGKGLRTVKGGELFNDIIYTFRTLGPVGILKVAPDEHNPASVKASIIVQFDQEVNKGDAETKFFTRPEISGSFDWQGNQMRFTPDKQLQHSQTYTFGFSEGVLSINGLASKASYQYSFTTEAEEYVLDVPFFKQEESFTCNIAAARQLLAYRGIAVSEAELKKVVGLSGRRGNGDPHNGYVDEYGTYWEALSRGVSKYRPTRVYLEWDLKPLLDELRRGNPVMIWGQNGWSDPHDISWKNPDGKQIKAVNGMHSSVVRGFRGMAEKPTHIIINDPWRGVYSITTDEFMRRWNFFKAAMVVD